MLCLKCKNEIPDDTLRCPHCGIKVNMYCPECGTLNRFGSKFCIECGSELLKVCLKCGSNNLYYATKCRKCSAPFNSEIVEQENPIEENNTIQEGNITQEVQETQELQDLGEDNSKTQSPAKKVSLLEFLNQNGNHVEENKQPETFKVDKSNINYTNSTILVKEEAPEEANSEIVFIDTDTEAEETKENSPIEFLELDSDDTNVEQTSNEQEHEINLIKQPETDTTINIPLPPPHTNNANRVIQSCIIKKSLENKEQKKGGGLFGFGKPKEENTPIMENQSPAFNRESLEDDEKKNLSIENSEDISLIEESDDISAISQEEIIQEKFYVAPEETQHESNIAPVEPNINSIQGTEEYITNEIDAFLADEQTPQKENISSKEEEHKESTISIGNYPANSIHEIITNLINTNQEKNVFAICGPAGCGKSRQIQEVLFALYESGYIPFYGNCTTNTQISCLGFFQDAFLSLLRIPTFTTNNNEFIKHNKPSLLATFTEFDETDLIDFINILYPYKNDIFENILLNKKRTFSVIKKALKSLLDRPSKLIMAVDNFDYIDSVSYELLCELADENWFGENLKLIISYENDKAAQSYIYSETLKDNNFETLHIEPLSQELSKQFLLQFINNQAEILPEIIWKNILDNSNGNMLALEQNIALLYDRNCLYVENDEVKFAQNNSNALIPENIENTIKSRIDSLIPPIRNALFTASLLGTRFDNQLFAIAMNMSEDKATQLLIQLKDSLYLQALNEHSMAFTSFTMWKIIFEQAKQCDQYRELLKNIEKIYKKIILSTPLHRNVICSDILEPDELFNSWKKISELVAYIGDNNLYVTIQKQKLKLLNDNNLPNTPELYSKICEEIGKLTYKTNPQDAIAYLSNSIEYAKSSNNILKAIDLCSYLVNSCYLSGNYYGVIEAIDLVISQSCNDITGLEIALLKERKLKALYCLGNSEEIVALMSNELCPIFQSSISNGISDVQLKNLTFNAWLEANIILAGAYSMQGNPQSFSVIKDIREFLPNITLNASYFATKIDLVEALAYTSKGNINTSNEILNKIAKEYEDANLDSDLLSKWNLINIINKIFLNKTEEIRDDLFELATFANNQNEQFIKNIIKLILGYLIKCDGNTQKALEIYNEQITYFAKEKNAIGALLAWYLIAQLTLITDDAYKALDIAQKALEVAEGPKINNFNFAIYLKKFIAEVFIIKGDLDSAKMHLEQAMQQAEELGLEYSMFKLVIGYANCMEEILRTNSSTDKKELVENILKTYNHAYAIAKKLDLENLLEEVIQAKSVFKTYCKLNNLSIDIEE